MLQVHSGSSLDVEDQHLATIASKHIRYPNILNKPSKLSTSVKFHKYAGFELRKLNTSCNVLSTYSIAESHLPWNRIRLWFCYRRWNRRGNLAQGSEPCYQSTWFESWRYIFSTNSMQFLVSDFEQIKQSIDYTSQKNLHNPSTCTVLIPTPQHLGIYLVWFLLRKHFTDHIWVYSCSI